jgi:hypothetical protein
MRLRTAFILLTAFMLVSVTPVAAQDTSDAAQALENLRGQLSEVQDKEADLKIRLEQLDFDLKPENIQRYFNAVGSTRPEELRESRRRQLQTEKDRLVAQLGQLESSRTRLEASISSAQVRVYQQSAMGTAALRIHPNRDRPVLTVGRALAGIVALSVIGSLVLGLVIRRRRKV